MMNRSSGMLGLPEDVLYNIFRFLDPVSLSSVCMTNSVLNRFVSENKWRIIDDSPDELKLVKVFPCTQETYKSWRYIIDLTGSVYHCYKQGKEIQEDILLAFADNSDINWTLICNGQKLSEDCLRVLHTKIPLTPLLTQQWLPINLLEEMITLYADEWNNAHWYYTFAHQKIDYPFIQKHIANVDWHAISQNKHAITVDLIVNHWQDLIWPEITKHGLIEELIEARLRYGELDLFSWINVAMHSKLSSNFIQKHFLSLPMEYLVRCQDLEEDMIQYIVHADNNYDNDVIWNTIAEFQRLSFQFISEHKNKLSLTLLIRNSKVKRFDLARCVDA